MHYRALPHPTAPGRYVVVHRIPGTLDDAIDEDCPTLASAEKQAAWLEAERTAAAHWHRHERQLSGVRP